MADPRIVNYEQALQAFYGTHSSGADVFAAGVSFENYLEDGTPTDSAGAILTLIQMVDSFLFLVKETPLGDVASVGLIINDLATLKQQQSVDGVNPAIVASLISNLSSLGAGAAFLALGPAGAPVFIALSSISLVASVYSTIEGIDISNENNTLLLRSTQGLDLNEVYDKATWGNYQRDIYLDYFNKNPITLPVLALMHEIDSNISPEEALSFIENSDTTNLIDGRIPETSTILKSLVRIFLNADLNSLTTKQEINTKVNELWVAFENNPLKGNVSFISPPASGEVARNDLGSFLSLFYLTPIAVQVNDAGANDFLYSIHESVADKWNDDRNLTTEQIANGEANFSNMWLTDRAKMLSVLIEANQNDNNFISRPHLLDNVVLKDLQSDTSLRINGMSLGIGITPQVADRYIVFGSGQGNVINGGERGDHLYGMGGNDEINGGDGNDYIEGNAGQDTLHGGQGNDTLLGGEDVDILNGGEGNDLLKGGEGVDVYQFNGTFGTDIVTDSDGDGFISINNNPLNNADYKFKEVYKNEATGYTVTKIGGGNTLVLSKFDETGVPNRIIVNKWSEADNLSLTLNGQAPAAPTTTLMGDFKKKIDDAGTSTLDDDSYMILDNNYINDGVEANAKDLLYGSGGNDVIDGGGGDDFITGEGGDDYIVGGNGNDLIQGGLGSDKIFGGDGDDALYAVTKIAHNKVSSVDYQIPTSPYQTTTATGLNWHMGYDDVHENGTPYGSIKTWSGTFVNDFVGDNVENYLDGGTGDDYLGGGVGTDYLIGGTGKDKIQGALGSDVILGGDGNDHIDGDQGFEYEGDGHDIIDGGQGDDFIYGNGGDDIIFGGTENDKLWGDKGYDFLFGGDGVDQLVGGDNDDYLEGGEGDDSLYGQSGNDTLDGGAGADKLYGGAGLDTLYVGNGDTYSTQDKYDKIYLVDGGNAEQTSATLNSAVGDGGAGVTLNLGFNVLINLGDGVVANDDSTITFADGSQILHSELLGTKLTSQVTISSTANYLFGGIQNDYLQATGVADSYLYGGIGNDTLIGNAGNNALYGGDGADNLHGDAGNDTLVGTGGIKDINNVYQGGDALLGGAGDDVYIVNPGDIVIDSEGSNVINTSFDYTHVLISGSAIAIGSANADYIFVQDALTTGQNNIYNFSTYTISHIDLIETNLFTSVNINTTTQFAIGGANDDTLSAASTQATTLRGGDGDDHLNGGVGDDTLVGGKGDDTLSGGNGSDVYIFSRGDGEDIINNIDSDMLGVSIDKIILGQDILTSDVRLSRIGNDLALNIGTTDKLRVVNYLLQDSTTSNALEQIVFADGTVWGIETVKNKLLYPATDGDDIIYGDEKINIIDGLAGSDEIYGLDGNDILDGGLGNDYLDGGLGDDILDGGFGDDLIMAMDGNDEVTGGAGNDRVYGLNGNDVVNGGAGNDEVYGGLGNDILSGGLGDDIINSDGATSDVDILTFSVGDGVDIANVGVGTDTIKFNDVASTEIRGLRSYSTSSFSDAIILDYGVDDSVVINGQTLNAEYQIDFIEFSDGVTWTYGQLLESYAITLSDDPNNGDFSRFASDASNKTIYAGAGNDDVSVWAGNNIIYGEEGDDTLQIVSSEEDTSNYLDGGQGNDSINGGDNNDIIIGGIGNDVLDGARGNNIYRFDTGFGRDTLQVFGNQANVSSNLIELSANVGDDSSVIIIKENKDIRLIINGVSDKILIRNFYYAPISSLPNYLEVNPYLNYQIKFSNGVIWDSNEIHNQTTVLLTNDFTFVGTELDENFTTGSGNDELYGNFGNDVLYGGAGNDLLVGGAGNDSLNGDDGIDTYLFGVGDGQDEIHAFLNQDVLTFKEGINPSDVVATRVDGHLKLSILNTSDSITVLYVFDSPDYSNINEIRFNDGTIWNAGQIVETLASVYGTAGSDNLIGTISKDKMYGLESDDSIYGLDGNDHLDGGLGADYMSGGMGNDTFVVDNLNDVVIEDADQGHDYILSSISYTLSSNIEELTLTGQTAITATGNSLHNNIYGNDADNLLDGKAGSDYMQGGLGNDTYIVDDVDDGVFEQENEGTDLVQSNVTYTIYDYIENLILTGTSAINATGNTLDNVLTGNSANNRLTGYEGNDLLDGGTGNDTMLGGIGDDTYIVNVTTDVVTELANEGIDTIQTSVTLTSLANNVENLVLLGTTALNGTGNSLNNMITGNSAVNTLTGGSGNDTLNGAGGNDILVGGLGNDTYDYYAGQGNDQIDNTATDNATAIDKLYLRDITAASVALSRATSDLVVTINGSATVTVKNYFAASDNKIDQIVFIDGTIWNQADIQSRIPSVPTTGDDVLTGTSGNDTIDALAGSDTVSGGDGDDQLLGNTGNDTLYGEAGNDILNGGAGNDTMVGGLGNDTYTVDSTSDVVTESASAGTDSVNVAIATTSGTYTLAANVENATLTNTVAFTLTGNALDNALTGNAAANTLNGGDGNDTLNGLAGNDTMVGGLGNDIYTIDSTSDVVTEAASAGTDTVNVAIATASGTHTLAANVENATLTNTVAYNLTGNALSNVLTGNAQANNLNGGAGTDTMIGGDGNDTYTIDATGDVITENLNEGTDLVNVAIATASGSYTMAANVENATLTNTVAFTLTGNALDNVLTGNAAANTLNGGDGNDTLNGLAGNDTMVGGLGNDTYTIDATGDIVTEAAGAGTDLVNVAIATASGTYTLAANVENATLTNTVAFTLTGNALDNVLTGNAAANTLNGGDGNDTLNGLAGNDTMVGGLGNDTYTTDATGDVITEAANAGNDTVNVARTTSGGTYTLAANIENATLINTVAYNLTGNALANYMLGNAANNTFTDSAGGNDIHQGLAGIDTFSDTVGNNLFDGGIGNDIITAGSGRDLLIGGTGNDTITTGTGYDVISFNKGDGQDIINASTGADNTISLGGNFAYSDLSLTKATNDLIIKMGATDQITLKDWYASGATNKSVVNLQVIAEAMQGFSLGGADVLRNNKVETFNFTNLVAAFDAAGATANWQLTDARLTAHLQAGSDTAAIGGDLAYQYGKNSNLTGMGLLNAQSVINNASFGQTAQTLNNPSVWQAEMVKLA